MALVEGLCSHVAVMSKGRIVANGPVAQVRRTAASLDDAFMHLVGADDTDGRPGCDRRGLHGSAGVSGHRADGRRVVVLRPPWVIAAQGAIQLTARSCYLRVSAARGYVAG